MGIIRKQVGAEGEKKLFWLRKLLETKDVVVDDNVTMYLVKAINDILATGPSQGHQHVEQWRCLGKLLLEATRPETT
jgi:hypothetical protein